MIYLLTNVYCLDYKEYCPHYEMGNKVKKINLKDSIFIYYKFNIIKT